MGEGKERMRVQLANHVNYDNPLAPSTTGLINAVTLADGAVATAGTQPDVPRNLLVTISAATVTAATITVYGVDQNGELQNEVFTVTAAAQTYTGNIAWAYVSNVVCSGLASAGSETISIGFRDKLGLPVGKNGRLVEVFLACVAGAAETIGTVNRTYGTIDPTTATDNSADFDFWYSYEVDLL